MSKNSVKNIEKLIEECKEMLKDINVLEELKKT